MRIEKIMKVKVDVNQEHVGRIHGDNKSDTVDSENADEYKIMKRPFEPKGKHWFPSVHRSLAVLDAGDNWMGDHLGTLPCCTRG